MPSLFGMTAETYYFEVLDTIIMPKSIFVMDVKPLTMFRSR